MLTLAPPYILIIFLASGDVKVVQDLNRDSCHAARDVINTYTAATGKPAAAYCLNTLDPLGTP